MAIDREELIKKPIYDEYLKIQTEYEEMQKSEKASLSFFNSPFTVLFLSIIILIIPIAFSKSFNILDIGFESYKLTLPILSFFAGAFTFFTFRYLAKRRDIMSRNKFKKDILLDRLKELEILKHSNVEKILKRYNNIFY